jgi:thiol-disulfide isomerase/thioredoxin
VPATVLGTLLLAVANADPLGEKVSALRKEIEDAEAAYQSTGGSEKQREAGDTLRRTLDRNVPRILELIGQEPMSETTSETLTWIVANPRNSARPYGLDVVQLLRDQHGMNPKIGKVCRALGASWPWEIMRPTAEFLRTVADRNPDRTARAQATFALACLTKDKAGYIESWKYAPPSVVAELAKYVSGDLEKWKNEDLSTVRRQAESLFEAVIEKYADCPDLTQGAESEAAASLACQAKAELYELRHLMVGNLAPDLQGEDLEGRTLKLRDFRGKVVVVTFWASWCGPCMRMLPQERALVERMQGKPFAMIGVNGDSDRAGVKVVVREEGISWPSFWTGGPRGPIPTAWNVKYWPTVYVLDPEGRIRFKANAGIGLEEVVDRLLSETSQSRVQSD